MTIFSHHKYRYLETQSELTSKLPIEEALLTAQSRRRLVGVLKETTGTSGASGGLGAVVNVETGDQWLV